MAIATPEPARSSRRRKTEKSKGEAGAADKSEAAQVECCVESTKSILCGILSIPKSGLAWNEGCLLKTKEKTLNIKDCRGRSPRPAFGDVPYKTLKTNKNTC